VLVLLLVVVLVLVLDLLHQLPRRLGWLMVKLLTRTQVHVRVRAKVMAMAMAMARMMVCGDLSALARGPAARRSSASAPRQQMPRQQQIQR
jgi:hypothetical protein